MAIAARVTTVAGMKAREDEGCSDTCEVGSLGDPRDAARAPRLDGSRSSWHGVAAVLGAFLVAVVAPPPDPAQRIGTPTAAATLPADRSAASLERLVTGDGDEAREVLSGETRIPGADAVLLRVVERAELDQRGALLRARIEIHDAHGPRLVRTLDAAAGWQTTWGDGGERSSPVDTRHPWVYLPAGPDGARLTPVSALVIERATAHAEVVLWVGDDTHAVPRDQLRADDGAERWVFAGDDVARFEVAPAPRLLELQRAGGEPWLTPFPAARASDARLAAAGPAR